MTTTCVFVGPTLWRDPLPSAMTRFGPAALGSVFRAVEAGYRRIAIVDGLFGNAPAVWHKEILYAISRGVEVVGAASMGALRAAELAHLGMGGIGTIFRMYRRGHWSDDDEVAVLHAPADLAYQPLSESMADVRLTLRGLRVRGLIDAAAERALVARMKAIHFAARSEEALDSECSAALGRAEAARILALYRRHRLEAKRRDALALVARMGARGPVAPPAAERVFETTRHWRRQFEANLADIPPLR